MDKVNKSEFVLTDDGNDYFIKINRLNDPDISDEELFHYHVLKAIKDGFSRAEMKVKFEEIPCLMANLDSILLDLLIQCKIKLQALDQKFHTLFILTRDDYNRDEDKPTFIWHYNTLEGLKNRLYQYLRNHRADEDYMDDEEFDAYISNPDIIFDKAPELNCAFILHYFPPN